MSDTEMDPSYSLESSPPPESPSETAPSTSRSSAEPSSSNGEESTANDANNDTLELRSSRTHQKRPSEDWSQFAASTAQRKKLCNENRETLLKFATLDQTERDIVLCAGILKMGERLDKIQPAQAAFEVDDGLAKFIDLKSFEVIMRPDLSAYIAKDHPLELIKDILFAKEAWDMPRLKEDPKKLKVVIKAIRTRLTNWRHAVKKAIELSIGTPSDTAEDPTNIDAVDILELCRDIKSKHKTALDKEPGLEMLGRIAFLRYAHIKFLKTATGAKSSTSKDAKDSSFWQYVDSELEKLRKLHNNNDRKISQVFLKILKADQNLYGSVELPTSQTNY